MRRLLISLTVVSGVILSTAAVAEFTGEVLIAPPPPHWTGGTPVETDAGQIRTWRKKSSLDSGNLEVITVRRIPSVSAIAPEALVGQSVERILDECRQHELDNPSFTDTPNGIVTSLSLDCFAEPGLPADSKRHTRLAIHFGEYATYTVRRDWTGGVDDPTGPTQSPRVIQIWDRYFSQIRVCNTLVDPCDSATAARIHADPKFRTMRDAADAERPVLPADDVLAAAVKFGRLTGQAQACGEDVSPLLLRAPRMFEYVSANDREAGVALDAFQDARRDASVKLEIFDASACGDTRREFRAHPSRVQGFPKFIERLLAAG